MERLITGLRNDADGQWIADLECGHSRHVRHTPPWEVRPWILDEASRRAHLGTPLECRRCDAPDAASGDGGAYDDARMRGLCHDGAMEIARTIKEEPDVPKHQDPVQLRPSRHR